MLYNTGMYYGSGTKSREWPLSDGKTLVLKYKYVELFFCPISMKRKWYVIGDKRSEDVEISKEAAYRLLPTGTKPDVPFWDLYGGYFLLVLLIALFIFEITTGWNTGS
ncbi:MAG: hypothetical protein JWO84_286 [Parcubacteria group bacterium]|nr:hypothetical protein [Parcubacteria group bacterium]